MLTAPDAWLSMVNQRRTELLAEADRQRLAAAVARPDRGWLRRLAALRHRVWVAPVARHGASAAPVARREVPACPPPATRPA
jgi:hypothetical protein